MSGRDIPEARIFTQGGSSRFLKRQLSLPVMRSSMAVVILGPPKTCGWRRQDCGGTTGMAEGKIAELVDNDEIMAQEGSDSLPLPAAFSALSWLTRSTRLKKRPRALARTTVAAIAIDK